MKKRTQSAILIVALLVVLTGSNQLQVHAEPKENNTFQEETEDSDLEETDLSLGEMLTSTVAEVKPIVKSVIMLKDRKKAKIPVYITGGSMIDKITTSQGNFKAEYEEGMIYITAFNTDDYDTTTDILLQLTVDGMDINCFPFSESIEVMIEIETEESVNETLNKDKPIDISMMSAYDRTMYLNALDRRKIAINDEDFSDVLVTCIGDSITEGVGLLETEQSTYSYPSSLCHILGANEVVNLGQGGTSIASYWDSFLKLTKGINEDTDIIIVLGGVNDCYSGNKDNIGNFETCEAGTFYGDTDYLMKELKKNFRDSQILFVTPLETVTNTTYLSFLPDMLPLKDYADAIVKLGEKNDIPVYDIFDEAFMDSHDEIIFNEYMYDGVHPNAAGYYMLAQHIAGKLIDMEKEDNED